MAFFTTWYVLPVAFIIDLVLGDPVYLPHPIRWMGKAISLLEPVFRSLPFGLTLSGTFFSLFLIITTWIFTTMLVAATGIIHPFVRNLCEIVLIYYAISARSLEDSALEVFRALKQNCLNDAKAKVAYIVGRDVDRLSAAQVACATVETVSENLVDGVISPLFFAAIGGAPLAMAYKMVNTLDSMIGYKNETYRDFGKSAAKIDDIANFIPARLSIAVISIAAEILARKGLHAYATATSEGASHTSPNAGYPEAAFAGALGVRLGGPNDYHGHLVKKPYIGTTFGLPRPNHIKKACDLMMLSTLIWIGILGGIMAAFCFF